MSPSFSLLLNTADHTPSFNRQTYDGLKCGRQPIFLLW